MTGDVLPRQGESQIRPYYDEGGITIYHGDWRDVVPRLDVNSIDLLLTDPPFFMPADHHASRTHWQRAWADTSLLATFWGAFLDAAIPKVKKTGHVIAFCDGASYPVFYPEVYRRFDQLVSIVWDKGSIGMGRVWRRQHELLIAARWDGARFTEEGGSRSDVITAKVTPSANRLHPVEKPDALLRQLIEPTTARDDLILDPFMGSGSTLTAARQLGRRAIGVEAEERYCEGAAKRLAPMTFDLGLPEVA